MGALRVLLGRFGLVDPLSESERRGHLSAIEEFTRLLTPDRGAVNRTLDGFYRRYEEACKRKEEKAFLETERRSLENRIRSASTIPVEKPKAEEGREGIGVIASIYASYAKRLTRYPRVTVGPGASAEIEHLYGCLQQFEKKYLPLLEKTVSSLSDRGLSRDLGEVRDRFHPLTAHGSRLPVVFDQYLARVARCRNEDDAEKEGQGVLREAWQAFRRVKQLTRTARDHKEASHGKVVLGNGQRVTAEAAALAVLDEIEQIFHDFRLKGLE